MLKDRRVCDRCDRSHGRDGSGWMRCIQDGSRYTIDLCNDCASKFVTWARQDGCLHCGMKPAESTHDYCSMRCSELHSGREWPPVINKPDYIRYGKSIHDERPCPVCSNEDDPDPII